MKPFWFAQCSVILVALSMAVMAKDITLSTNQTEYYVPVGQDAVLVLHADNSYGKAVDGTFTYTVVQQIQQQGFSYSSSNTQSTPFSIQDAISDIPISFGTTNQPLTLAINMRFEYTEKDNRFVDLNGIIIHFITDPSQQQNPQNKKESSSQKSEKQEQTSKPKSQQQAQQQSLQNNQLPHDTSALKQQLEEEAKRQRQLQEAFGKNLAGQQEFQNADKNLTDLGYKQTQSDLNPSSEYTGDFAIHYQKGNGDKASISGRLDQGQLIDMVVHSSEEEAELKHLLEEDPRFTKYNSSLVKDHFSVMNFSFAHANNATTVQVLYQKGNSAATITAAFVNKTITQVALNREAGQFTWWSLGLILVLITAIAVYYVYFKKRKQNVVTLHVREIKPPFDYVAESHRLLRQSKVLFSRNEYKEAYSLAAQALRVFLSYHYGLSVEVTSDEIIAFLRTKKLPYGEIRECFDLCCMVEFAKYEANAGDFSTIITIVQNQLAAVRAKHPFL